jgi:hypothetical protein
MRRARSGFVCMTLAPWPRCRVGAGLINPLDWHLVACRMGTTPAAWHRDYSQTTEGATR